MAEPPKELDSVMAGRGFAALVACRYSGDLHAYVSRRVGNRHDVEDVAQEVWLRIVRIEGRTEDQALIVDKPFGFLCRIADWVMADFRAERARERAHRAPSDDIEDWVDSAANEDTAKNPDGGWDAHQQIESALSQLSPKLNATWILVRRDGLSYAQAAKRLGISVSGVKKNLQRAQAQLRAILFPNTGG